MRAPRQDRSRDTLKRIVAATKQLLEERSFAAIAVTEIVERAGSSVGSFYARFADKDALLDYLDECYAQDLLAQQEAFIVADRRRRAPLAEKVTELVAWLVRYHRQQRGLVRALVLRARTRLEPRFRERTSRMNERLPEVLAVLSRHRGDIRHPHPERAVALGFSFALSALRERILFPESIDAGEEIPDEMLVEEISRSYLAYLGSDGGGRAAKAGTGRRTKRQGATPRAVAAKEK